MSGGESDSAEFSSTISPYLSRDTIAKRSENVVKTRELLEIWLSPFEANLMKLQSLLVGEKPVNSLLSLLGLTLLFWLFYSDRILGVVSFLSLGLYLVNVWRNSIWPTIRVPISRNEEEEWTPVYANLLSFTDICERLAEAYVSCAAYYEALGNLRRQRRSAFLVLMWVFSAVTFVIGHYISGPTLFFLTVYIALLAPCAIQHKVLSTAYMKVEPYLMALQYKLISRTPFNKQPRQSRAANGDTAEIDPDEDAAPAANPQLNAAIARTITDSEDESVGGGNFPPEHVNELEADHDINDLVPDVSLMPDFEGICEDSQTTFMLDTDAMPSLDDVDRSRLITHQMPGHQDTDSDTESLPFDEGLPTHLPVHSQPAMPAASAHNPTDPSRGDTAALAMGALTNAASGFLGGMLNSLQQEDLRHDPRDRIADASREDNFDDEEFDFEIISKEDIQ